MPNLKVKTWGAGVKALRWEQLSGLKGQRTGKQKLHDQGRAEGRA